MKKIAIWLVLSLLGFWAPGCHDSSSSESEIEWFSIIEEESGDDSGSGAGGLRTLCDFAPRYGTLVLAEVVSAAHKITTQEESCSDDYPYRSGHYRQLDLKLHHDLAGPALPSTRLDVKIMGGYVSDNIAAGDFRILTITPELRGDRFGFGEGYLVEPQPAETASVQDQGRVTFRIPRNVNQLETDLRAYMAANPQLPEDCEGNSITYYRRDEDSVSQNLFLQPGETKDGCNGEPLVETESR